MTRTTIFKSNRSQAVRLPKPVAFPEDVHDVEVIKVGKSRIVSPIGHRWDEFFEHGPRATSDFMKKRVQPKAEKRGKL
jgi:antitoxin VapB